MTHNLHGPERLYATRYGHVKTCPCCDRVQITLSHETLLLDEASLETLAQTFTAGWDNWPVDEESDPWKLEIATDAGTVDLILTRELLQHVQNLICGAWRMYQLNEQIRCICGNSEGSARDILRNHMPDGNEAWG